MRERAEEPFRWLPGRGCDAAALHRLRAHFPRPDGPLPDAWFLAGAPPRGGVCDGFLSYWEVRDALYDLATNAARRTATPAARGWFHYLLAQEIPGAMFGSTLAPLIEALATGIFVLYPHGPEAEPYAGFFRDCLDTLGRAIMTPDGWSARGVRRGVILRRRWNVASGWDWGQPGGDLSASMFLCLKYLPQEALAPWLRSILQIRDPFWRAQLLAWFVGARELLEGSIEKPADPPLEEKPAVSWVDCNLIAGETPFLSRARRRAALDAVTGYFEDETFAEWAKGVLGDEELAADLGQLPWRFRDLFLCAPAHAPRPLCEASLSTAKTAAATQSESWAIPGV